MLSFWPPGNFKGHGQRQLGFSVADAVLLSGQVDQLSNGRRRAYRPGTMAAQGVHPVADQRSDLVDTVWLVSV